MLCDTEARPARVELGVRVVKYQPAYAPIWNGFLATASNATFLFHRDFLEYHSDRFVDCSLLVFDGEELTALLPANLSAGGLVSHGGLTYGGLVVRSGAGLEEIARSFRDVLAWCAASGIATLDYRRVPRIYARLPDDEMDYLLFLVGARLYRRDLSAAVERGPNALPYRKDRRSSVSTAVRRGCRIEPSQCFAAFWNNVLTPTLEARHGAKPVHSLEEIALLAERFPANIKQFNAIHNGEVVAGATMFVTERVAHTQYLAVTEEGRRLRALDLLIDHLLRNEFAGLRYFDFGTSNEQGGRV
ncbi:MAG: GNAT family N-acetyltransferase, partial [Pirellulales bacterium]